MLHLLMCILANIVESSCYKDDRAIGSSLVYDANLLMSNRKCWLPNSWSCFLAQEQVLLLNSSSFKSIAEFGNDKVSVHCYRRWAERWSIATPTAGSWPWSAWALSTTMKRSAIFLLPLWWANSIASVSNQRSSTLELFFNPIWL